MTASAVRFLLALAAMAPVVRGHASLHTAFVSVAAGNVAAAAISLPGFVRTRWDR